MAFKKILVVIRKKWVDIFVFSILLLILTNAGAKSWVLEQLISTNLFNARIKNDAKKTLAQDISLSVADSNNVVASIHDLKGKVVFINFWASWCPPCRAEMPSLNELYLKLKNDDHIVFLFVNEDEEKSKGLNYLKEHHFVIPFYARLNSTADTTFTGILPTTIIVSKEGKIVFKHEGMAGYNTAAFIKQLKEM